MLSISKQLVCQKYIYKIRSSRLRKERWKLDLSLEEARRNDEIISLADSQMLRWIDEINGITDADAKARDIKLRIKNLRREPNSRQNIREIKRLYNELDALQFKPDYMCLVIDKKNDYYRACKGFSINGIKYKRLLGTNGGIKNSTIVFVSERLSEELKRRVENGSGEPEMTDISNYQINLDASDGYGLMLPRLAKRWSKELGLDYTVSCCNTRYSFEKGIAIAFDFLDFAENVAHNYFVKDAWGDTVDIRDVELILTTSMVKLWDSYDSCEEYIRNSTKNGYEFGIAKTSPEYLENVRSTNYQFLQGYSLDDSQIEELIVPTINEIRDVLSGDWRKTVLFLKGSGLTEGSVARANDDFIKAIMIDHRILDDPFVQSSIYQLIRNRINEAKVGVLKVHGNYSIISGDPYLLCQSIFGMELTGLLKAGEIYNEYWGNVGSNQLACFRAPMSVQNNVRKVTPVFGDEVRHWYQYIKTCTVFNAWDTATAALNG